MAKSEQLRQPITERDAPSRPWRLCTSQGGKLYIYAHGESQPVALIKSRKNLTRSDRATLELICMAVNRFHADRLGFILEVGRGEE